MSGKAYGYAMDMTVAPSGRPITKAEKLVLAVLADNYNTDRRYAYPKMALLAKKALSTKNTTRDAVKALMAEGVLYVTQTPTEQGDWSSNKFWFPHFERTECRQPFVLPPGEHPAYDMPVPPWVFASNLGGTPSSREEGGTPTQWEEGTPSSREEVLPLSGRRYSQFHVTQTLSEHLDEHLDEHLESLAVAPSAPAPARVKSSSAKSTETPEDAALTASCRHVYDAITTDHVLSRGDCIQLRQSLRPFVERYGAEDVLAWHRAACAAKDGNYVPVSYAARGIRGWIAAGRPAMEPSPFSVRRETNGRNAAVTGVIAASQIYGDNERYRRAREEYERAGREEGAAV